MINILKKIKHLQIKLNKFMKFISFQSAYLSLDNN